MKKYFFVCIVVIFTCLIFSANVMAAEVTKPPATSSTGIVTAPTGATCPSGFEMKSPLPGLRCVRKQPTTPCPAGFDVVWGPCPTTGMEPGPSCAFKCMPKKPLCTHKCSQGYTAFCGTCETGCQEIPK